MTTMNQQTIEQLQQEIARLQTELKHNEQRSQVEKMKEKNVAFSESLIQKGRLKPKHRAAFVAMLNFADVNHSLTQSEIMLLTRPQSSVLESSQQKIMSRVMSIRWWKTLSDAITSGKR